MSDDAKLLTVAAVSDRLNVSKETVRKLCRSNKLEAVKIGTDWRITEDAYKALITPAPAETKPHTQRKNIAQLLRSA
jgi:excisionase family DNA binding protein